MPKAIILHALHDISYEKIRDEYVYQPSQAEEIAHGTKVLARQNGTPQAGEIEVRALVGAVCTHEVSLYLGDLTHPRYPMVPGHEAVHEVIRTGPGVEHVQPGDYVSCCWYMGQWSEKLIGPANLAYRLPQKLGDPAHWLIEPAASVVNAVSYMTIRPGDRLLLIGAGFMGLLLLQLLKGYPLASLVVSDLKQTNRELAKECGAELVLEPDQLADWSKGKPLFDVVIESSGSQAGLDAAVNLAGMASRIYLFGWHRQSRQIDFKLGHLRGQQFFHTAPALDDGRAYERYWPKTIELFEKGIFDLAPLISHSYPAEDIKKCMVDSVARPEGFIKSVIYFE